MNYNVNKIKEKLNKVDVVFFDLDGTLIDTERLYFRFWKEACAFFGYQMSDEEALNMRSRERSTGLTFLKEISNGLLDYDQVRDKRIELMNEYFKEHPIQIKDHAVEFLKQLKDSGKKLYIVTANKADKAINIMSSIGIEQYFESVISAKDVIRGKPFPDVYLKACGVVGSLPKKVVVFEDSPNGLKSSYAAGCFTVMIEDITPFTPDMDYVDGAIESFKELL